MFKKVLFISLVLAGLLLFGTIDKSLADASAQLEQAEQYYVKDGNYQQAETIYKTIVTDYPGTDYALEAQKELTILYIAWGKQSQAEAAYEKLLTEFSENKRLSKGFYKIAKAYGRRGKHEKARELYQYVLDNWPGSEEAMDAQARLAISNIRLGDEGAAQAAIEKLLTEFSENKRLPEGVYDIAKAYGGLGKYEKARQLYQYVLDNWLDSEKAVDAQAGLAISYIGLGDDSNAQAAIDKLLTEFSEFSENKRLPEGFYNIAKAYGGLGKDEKARELYQYVLDNWPDSEEAVDAQAGLAISYFGLGDDPNARAALDELIADLKDHPDLPREISNIEGAYYNRILAAETCVRENYRPPVIMWEKVLSEFPDFFHDDPDLYYFIADCYRQLGEYEKAVEYYGIVADIWTQNGYAVLTHISVPQVNPSTDDYQAVLALIDSLIVNFGDHPGLPAAILRIGQEYYNRAHWAQKQGLDAEANEYYLKAITLWETILAELPPSAFSATTCYFLAVSYRQLDERQKVIGHCWQLLTNWPDYEYAGDAKSMINDFYQRWLSNSGK